MSTPAISKNELSTYAARLWPALSLHALVLLLGWALFWKPAHWGHHDWDYFAHHYEAMRRSVLEYHQIPWWNPWSCGGMPLAANPQLGLLSINFLLVLLFGTYPGLKLATWAHLFIAAEGARRLAGHYVRDRAAGAMAGFIFVANGALAVNVASGMLGVLVMAWAPWAIALVLRIEQDARWGVALGVVVALALLESIHYFAVQLVLVLAALGIWRLWKCRGESRKRLWIGIAWAGAVGLALAGLRVALATELVLDFPRSRSDQIRPHITLEVVGIALLRPFQHLRYRVPDWYGNLGLGWHEFDTYVGVLTLALFIVSVKSGWRWWHSLAVACLWLAVGNRYWYHASAWLAELPVLGAMRVATRWRVMAMLGIALGCGAVLSQWRSSPRRPVRVLASALIALVAFDLGINAWPIYAHTFVNSPQRFERSDEDREFVQLETLAISPIHGTQMMALLRANYGVVYGYEPLMGQDDDPLSSRLWEGHADYRGEHWSPAGPVEVIRWSPNAIELVAPPHAEIHVNQNPGSYWLAGGRRAFPQLRSVDRHQELVVSAGSEGRVELSVRPSGWVSGCMATGIGLAGVALLAAATAWNKGLRMAARRPVRGQPECSSCETESHPRLGSTSRPNHLPSGTARRPDEMS